MMADWTWVVYTGLEVLIALVCCLGNALVVFAVCVGIKGALHEPTFCFVVSLAAADFLVGVAAVPLAVLLDGWVHLAPQLCLLLSCVVLVLTQASVLSLLAIAVDRHLRLQTPLRYETRMSALSGDPQRAGWCSCDYRVFELQMYWVQYSLCPV